MVMIFRFFVAISHVARVVHKLAHTSHVENGAFYFFVIG